MVSPSISQAPKELKLKLKRGTIFSPQPIPTRTPPISTEPPLPTLEGGSLEANAHLSLDFAQDD
jgi:hypothetical protein